MKSTPLAKLEAARAKRPPGYIDALYAAGIVRDGRLHIPEIALIDLQRQFGVTPAPAPRGLGDLVAAVAQPIARAIDRVAGTNLQNCGGCKSRQAALNKMFPAKTEA